MYDFTALSIVVFLSWLILIAIVRATPGESDSSLDADVVVLFTFTLVKPYHTIKHTFIRET